MTTIAAKVLYHTPCWYAMQAAVILKGHPNMRDGYHHKRLTNQTGRVHEREIGNSLSEPEIELWVRDRPSRSWPIFG